MAHDFIDELDRFHSEAEAAPQPATRGPKLPPDEITVMHLECVVMPNGEVICDGKSLGWVTGRNGKPTRLAKYLKAAI